MRRNILFLCLCLIIYLVVSQTVFIPIYGDYFVYVLRPLSFIILTFFTYYLLGDKYTKSMNRMLEIILIIVLAYVVLYYTSGFIFGFTKSTYSTTILGILKNIYSIVLIIILQEYIRYRMLTYLGGKNTVLVILISLIFTLTEINYIKIMTTLNSAQTIEFVFSKLIPLICFNFFNSYIVMVTSYKGSLIFRIIPTLLQIIIPIFPTWNWYLLGCFEVVYIGISYYIIKFYLDKFNDVRLLREKKSISGNLIFGTIIIIFILFVNGAFKYVPIAVMSNSMYPVFQRGDVLVYEKVDLKQLEVGNVLVFRLDDKIVLHRIRKITWKNDKIYIITKGDNLKSPDPQITTNEDVIGRMIFKVPAIGYPSVILYEMTK